MIGLIVVGIFLILVIIWRRSKGKRGEKQVAALLRRLPEEEYKVINDLLIQSNGYSDQVDHVVVSRYGVFAIETKYYQGWIYGGVNSEFWTQNIYGNKYQLRNPLWQNQGHIRAIRKLLGDTGGLPFYSIVAFSRQGKIRKNPTLPVMYWGDIVPYIKSYSEPHMTELQAEEIYRKLLAANVMDKAAKKEHIASVKDNQSRRNIAVANGKCPRCGGNLVLRNGKYGQFYGCSNYPDCKYILK